MMTARKDHTANMPRSERGFVLITALLILLVLTVIGVIASRTTVTELMVAGNDKVHKQTFYQADGGTELAQHLIFNNAICTAASTGFTSNYTFDSSPAARIKGGILVEDLVFTDTQTDVDTVTTSSREFAYFPGVTIDDSAEHTNFGSRYITVPNPGSGQQSVSGYQGLGGGQPSGTSRLYTIASQHHGQVGSQSEVQVRWRIDNFLISSAALSDCDY